MFDWFKLIFKHSKEKTKFVAGASTYSKFLKNLKFFSFIKTLWKSFPAFLYLVSYLRSHTTFNHFKKIINFIDRLEDGLSTTKKNTTEILHYSIQAYRLNKARQTSRYLCTQKIQLFSPIASLLVTRPFLFFVLHIVRAFKYYAF